MESRGVEVMAALIALAVAITLVAVMTRGRGRIALVGGIGAVALASLLLLRSPSSASAPSAIGDGTALGYVSSAACRSCHPAEHASFSRTYHRTMTQVATAENVKAIHASSALHAPGVRESGAVRLEQRGEEVWATLPDPDDAIGRSPAATAPIVTRRVLLTTGSHREQAYWVAGKRRGDLRLVPFVWLVREEAFVARHDAFLTPPDAPLPPVRWASSCIACHAVAGEPRHDLARDAFDTRAAELGIACEACHGPGAAHVEKHRDPVARYTQHLSREADATIVQPKRLPPERSAAVCGQCHAYAFPRDENGWWSDGYSRTFRAGDLLEPSRSLIVFADMKMGTQGAPVIDAPSDAIFWSDGGVRVGGREYNGLVASPCYERGHGDLKMTCLSCHAMHEGDPSGQIAPPADGDRACTQCHSGGRLSSAQHTHHAPGSPGSACVACHMPKTSYALLSAVRSHRIDSPRTEALGGGKPNACNLCHLDRSLAWTARTLADWYQQPTVAVPELQTLQPVGLVAGIAGDAGVRALVADALGTEEGRRALVSAGFSSVVLREMLQDPYAAVRFIAERSLRRIGAHERLGAALPPEQVRALLALRDQRAITIAE